MRREYGPLTASHRNKVFLSVANLSCAGLDQLYTWELLGNASTSDPATVSIVKIMHRALRKELVVCFHQPTLTSSCQKYEGEELASADGHNSVGLHRPPQLPQAHKTKTTARRECSRVSTCCDESPQDELGG